MDENVRKELAKLRGWVYKNGEIQKAFAFENFAEGLDFVNKVAGIAEDMGHHPDVLLAYKSVTLRISTHSENAVTGKDIEFAKRVEKL